MHNVAYNHLFSAGVGKTQATQGEFKLVNSLSNLPFSLSPCYKPSTKWSPKILF